tara:strand:- start:1637 stop:1846 length:210 start_codon:yes stop_codon:yes gene_type:complete
MMEQKYQNEIMDMPYEPEPIDCPVVLTAERIKNGGLTNQEVADGFFIDIVLGKCNIRKALKERNEAIGK